MDTKDISIVEFKNITKSFSGVKALDDVSFKIAKGKVHCLLGENGAGKSTLIKILSGVIRQDSGTILFNGKPLESCDIWSARNIGIGTVYQENSLISHLSIAENVYLSRELKNKYGFIDYKKMENETEMRANELGVKLDSKLLVKDLSVAEQQIVEIVKIFSQNPQFVILDEPTSSLSDNEIKRLFNIINKMKEKGVTFVYISHRMKEIQEIGDDGSVLRDGKFITNIPSVKESKIDDIISYVVGRPLEQVFPHRTSKIYQEIALEVKNLSAAKNVKNICFSVKKGEVFGFSGLVGAGRTETAKTIFGEMKKTSGKVIKNGVELKINCPRDAINSGIGFLTENRKEEGLFLSKSVGWNIVSASLNKIKLKGFLNSRKETNIVNRFVNILKIKTQNIDSPVKFLSGGNQQKVVFAKWLCAGSDVYIFDEPTRGIDVGGKSEIYKLINSLTDKGNSVIIISSELPEVIGVCDRIAVFREGEIVKVLNKEDATQEKIMYYAMGGK